MLVQMNPNGTSNVLFPDARVNNGDNHLEAGQDTTIPSKNSWFTFDNDVGTERILAFLKPDGNSSGQVWVPSAPSGRTLDAQATASLTSEIKKQHDSKAIFLETDQQGPNAADYAVATSVSHKTGAAADPVTLTLEIQLKHQ